MASPQASVYWQPWHRVSGAATASVPPWPAGTFRQTSMAQAEHGRTDDCAKARAWARSWSKECKVSGLGSAWSSEASAAASTAPTIADLISDLVVLFFGLIVISFLCARDHFCH